MPAVRKFLAALLLVIGVALLIETIAVGGGQVGFLAAAVFIALGLLRLRAAR
jgi:hypothetical protein